MTAPLLAIDNFGFAWPRRPSCWTSPAFASSAARACFSKAPRAAQDHPARSDRRRAKAARGSVRLLDRDLGSLSAGARDRFRVDHTGYIFSSSTCCPFSVRENVGLPCHFSRLRAERARAAARTDAAAASLLEHLGLAPELFERRADALSIGQQQRVAAARALIGQPELVIADEPTSALDADSREAFLKLLFSECRAAGASLLFVSHDQSLAPLFDRSLSLADLNRAARAPEC